MIRKASAILLAIASLAAGCRSGRDRIQTIPAETRIESRIIHAERVDTLYVEVPLQSQERSGHDSVSYLKTGYAESRAEITADGKLTHWLRNLPGRQPVAAIIPCDTVYKDNYVERPLPAEAVREVERRFTLWEEVRLRSWLWIASLLLISVALLLRRLR